MKYCSLVLTCICTTLSTYADTIVWTGDVQANGTPTSIVQLDLGKTYQIKVSGTMNLGKWWQQGKPLEEDACYEFNQFVAPSKLDSFMNSLNIPLHNDSFHPDHIYQTKPFVAAQSGIHFWIHDTDYSDNTGALQVELIEVADK